MVLTQVLHVARQLHALALGNAERLALGEDDGVGRASVVPRRGRLAPAEAVVGGVAAARVQIAR